MDRGRYDKRSEESRRREQEAGQQEPLPQGQEPRQGRRRLARRDGGQADLQGRPGRGVGAYFREGEVHLQGRLRRRERPPRQGLRRQGRLCAGAEEEGVRPLLNAWSAASPIPTPCVTNIGYLDDARRAPRVGRSPALYARSAVVRAR